MNRIALVPAALLMSFLAACSTGPSGVELAYDGIGPDSIDSVDKRERFDKAVLPLEFKNERVSVKPGYAIAASASGSAAAVKRGNDAVNLNARDVATVEFVNAIRMNPKNADAFFGLGNSVTMRGKTNEAIAAYATALELRPGWIQARYELGMGYWKANRMDEATAQFRAILDQDARHGPAHERLAVAAYYAGDKQEALRHAAAAKAAGTDVPAQLYELLK
ncbi:MAG: tetratricopeptide repeat protein [Phycisphaerales bacterium]|jgi:tetratricopeptide (TPR) repeat protein|nr:tetratricopeptide repeat protein [Phycisphaerales bacterium]